MRVLELLLKLNSKAEGRALSPLALKPNHAVEPLDNLLGDDKSKTNTSSVHVLGALNKAKKLEQLLLILPLYTHAGIFDLDFTIGLAIKLVKRVKH